MKRRCNIAFFGCSILSDFQNEAATYYRGLIRALADRGHRCTFFEPEASERQKHRDLPEPDWVRSVVYPPEDHAALETLEQAEECDLVIKCSGVGLNDDLLEAAVLELKQPETMVAFLDLDAPATLDRIQADPEDSFRPLIPEYDVILVASGGPAVFTAYQAAGAAACVPIYAALDSATHFPEPLDGDNRASLAFLGDWRPDRESRLDHFFFATAAAFPDRQFILGGSGWDKTAMPANVKCLGHVATRDHNAFNAAPLAVLAVTRESAARYGFAASARIFEAAGAGACVITDKWEGVEQFFEPGREILVAENGAQVADRLRHLTSARAKEIGEAACRRARAEHLYARRAEQIEHILDGQMERAMA